MPIKIACQKCGKKYRVKDELAGKTVRCKICRGRLDIPVVGEAQVIRHEARDRDFSLATGDEQSIEAISDHIEKHLGPIETVFHELVSDLVHIDVHVVLPTEARPWITLVTSGMSDLPMTVPEGAEDRRFAELMIVLPPDWPLTQEQFEDENNYWPIRWLKTLARLPHEYETWLGPCHTVPNGDPPEPLADGTEFCGFIVLPPIAGSEEVQTLEVEDETHGPRQIHFYAIVPLYPEEMEFKVNRGADALLERFDRHDINEVIDPNRRNTCRRK